MSKRFVQYSAEEAFERVLDELHEKFLPQWLRWMVIPLEVFEELFVEYLVYEEDIRKAVKHLVKKGLIKVELISWSDVFGKTHKLKMVRLSDKVLEDNPRPDVAFHLISDFYWEYQRLFKKPLTKGTIVTGEEYSKVLSEIFRLKAWFIIRPLIEKKILFSKKDLVDYVETIDSELVLWNLLVEIGIAEDVEEGNEYFLRILMDESEALAYANRYFEKKAGVKGNAG